LVAAGLGVSIVPRWTAQVLTHAVVYLPIDGDALHSKIGLAHRLGDRSRALRNFVTIAQRVMPPANQSAGRGIAKLPEKDNVPRH
jgi:DNA-binding transcriptional LysR family regulator